MTTCKPIMGFSGLSVAKEIATGTADPFGTEEPCSSDHHELPEPDAAGNGKLIPGVRSITSIDHIVRSEIYLLKSS
jgi:hypothetical protein